MYGVCSVQWGLPTFSTPGILSMVLAMLASIVVSVDDYCACARLATVSLPPEHAVNRGAHNSFGHCCFVVNCCHSQLTCY